MNIEQHDCVIESSFIEGCYTASCSCGWEGSAQEIMQDALDEWERHCDVVFMKATEEQQ